MAEQKPREKMNEEQEKAYLKNLFILFYTLRHLWKSKKRKVNDLYNILFPSASSTGGNKTLYDNILRLKDCKMLSHAKRLSEITGINEKYFEGEYKLNTNVSDEDWGRFIRLKTRRGSDSKGAELVNVENAIKSGINLTAKELDKQSDPFKRLAYFAEYGHKREDKKIEDLFSEIESKIEECRPFDLEHAQLELLEKHQEAIQTYLRRITAVATVRKWKAGTKI